MNKTTKGLLGLVLWLAAGFAFTQIATLSVSAWLNRPASTQGPVEALATAPSR